MAHHIRSQKIRAVASAIRQNKQGCLLVARDEKGLAHAASLLVIDGRAAYYLAQGSCPKLLHHGGASLLIWRAIQHCSALGVRQFDFTGSMMPGVGLFLRSFGAELVPHHYVSKENSMLFYWLMRGKTFLEERRRRRSRVFLK